MVITRNRFLEDPIFSTLQFELYDETKAEVLGTIQTSAIRKRRNFANRNWVDGHFLVIVWTDYIDSDTVITPYGDYMDGVQSDSGDGDVFVYETFKNPMIRRDGSPRDLTTNMNIVLDIKHDYDLDIEGKY